TFFYYHRKRDGKLIPVGISFSKIEFEGKRAVFSIARDISKWKREWDKLKESEEKYKFIIENSPDGIFIMDLNGNILSVNPTICERLGYSEKELLQMNLCDIVPTKYLKQWKNRVGKIMKGEILNTPAEYEVIRKDGTRNWIEVRSTPIKKDGKIIGFLGIARDITEKKQMEEKLHWEHKLLQTLINNVPDSVFFKDKENKFILVNKAKALHHNTTPEDMIGKTDFDFLPENEARSAWEDDENVLKTKKPLIGKIEQITRADGKKHWLSVTKIPLTNDEGEIIGTVGISRDITEQIEAQKSLKKTFETLDALINSIPDLIYFKNTERKYIQVNRAFEKFFNLSKKEIIGKRDEEILPSDLAKYCIRSDQKVLESKKVLRFTEKFQTPNEETIIFETIKTPLFDDKKNLIGIIGISRDITEAKKVEENIKLQKAFFQSLFENSPEAIVTLNRNGLIENVNTKFTELFGYTLKEIKGKNLKKLIVPEELIEEADQLVKTAMKEIISIETIRKKKDGTKFPVSILGAPIYIDKKIVGSFGIYRDLTEKKKMEEELIHSERLSTLGELIAGIAHELNNPLTTVIGYSEFILSTKMDEEELIDKLKKIKEEADRCFRIVQALLDIARYHPPGRDYTDLNHVIEKAIQIKNYEFSVDNIKVIKEFDYSIPPMKINEHRIQQAILNLLINAHEALLNKKGERRIEVKTKKEGKKALIEISDNGIGIAEENLGKIFLPFFTTKRGIKKGTGLGLSIVQKIVKEHNGNIYVSSKKGEGTTFTIILPFPEKVRL
ncbi:PAS domain S-box protein, partial [Candidatus Aminicenantes bacterium AC-335-B20]|nr:PAS domain S-box protein [Candidatus Aminicenantes bacterium AC-335-B20]